jgi:hypothetical protein
LWYRFGKHSLHSYPLFTRTKNVFVVLNLPRPGNRMINYWFTCLIHRWFAHAILDRFSPIRLKEFDYNDIENENSVSYLSSSSLSMISGTFARFKNKTTARKRTPDLYECAKQTDKQYATVWCIKNRKQKCLIILAMVFYYFLITF